MSPSSVASAATEFFVVALPGLEDLVLEEIRDWMPEADLKSEHGGITLHAPLEQGLALNLVLKTATRILIRVAKFRCRDFPALYKKVSSIEWKDWIDPSCELEVHAATRLSRLKIKRRIEETCGDAFMSYREGVGAVAKRGHKADLYVRFVNDECTLSLDTSGERLHKRGHRQFIGEAPLRETIAAALIQLVGRGDPLPGPVEIVDPMMGSGTFLIEAAQRDEVLAGRAFAFDRFARPSAPPPKLHVSRPEIGPLMGFERDADTLAAAAANLKTVRATVDIHRQDIFEAQPLSKAPRRWLFANPPYGERLKVKEPLSEYYARLFAACERVAQPSRACFLLPAKAVKGKFALPPGWKVLAKRPFVNGGIPVVAFVFGRGDGV